MRNVKALVAGSGVVFGMFESSCPASLVTEILIPLFSNLPSAPLKPPYLRGKK
jgi:hypothetical protein